MADDLSDMDTTSDVHSDDGNESEYEIIEEEIEVEEEVDEEVEVEVEEDEEIEEEEEETDEEEEEELGKIDADQGIKPVGMEKHVNPGSATSEKLVGNLPSDSRDVKQNEEFLVNGKGTPVNHGMTGDIASLSSGKVNTVTLDIGGSNQKAEDDPYLERITYQIDGEASRVRPISLTPESEFNDSSKRAATMCEFFAKGWCIRGKSCRFLHVKDEVGVSHSKREISDMAQKKSEPLVEGVTSSVQPTSQCGESHRQMNGMEDISLLRCEPLELSSQDFRRDSNDYRGNSSPWTKRASCRGTLSNNGSRMSENGENTRNTPHIFEEITFKSNNFLADNRNLPVPVSSLLKSPLSFSYPSWNTDVLGGQDLLDNGPQYHASRSASVQRSSSPHSGSESENLSRTNAFVDKQCAVGLQSKIPYNWEPSIPFQPSYPLTKSLLSKLSSRSEYDPIRDSIEDTASGKKASAIGAPKQGNGDVLAAGALGTECSSNKYSISDSNLNGVCSTKSLPGKDISKKGDNIETLGVQWKDRKALQKETTLLDSDHIEDAMGDKVSINGDSKLDSGGPYKSQSKEDRSRLIMEADADLKVEESRALRNFHASLVDVVKELLKPSWQRGLLSKDAHKIIVKKSVDKVLSTIPAIQVPNTAESVKLYLTASQEKLAKLVEGYVEKYHKS